LNDMKLLELYEDLFQYVCRLNRVAKTEAHPEYARVRSEVKTLLEEILSHHTGQTTDRIHKDSDRDFIMSAAEGKEYGVIDEVLTNRELAAVATAAGVS